MTQTVELPKAASYTTGMIHYATVSGTVYKQACGMSRKQLANLYPVAQDAEVTCKKCLGTIR